MHHDHNGGLYREGGTLRKGRKPQHFISFHSTADAVMSNN